MLNSPSVIYTTQKVNSNTFSLKSTDGTEDYTVEVQEATCSSQKPCIPQCSQPECGYVCRHHIRCSCLDYKHGHLCKHVHKVSMLRTKEKEDVEKEDKFSFQNNEQGDFFSSPCPKKQRLAGKLYIHNVESVTCMCLFIWLLELCAQKKSIVQYLEEIREAIQPVEESGVLEHVQSLLMQANTALKVASKTEAAYSKPFTKVEPFAPAQKNETQLRFKQTTGNAGRKRKHKELW